jgi:PleD family two-component response regulator
VFRYGGDEFVCLLPDTGQEAARSKLASVQQKAAISGVKFCFGLAQLERSDDVVSLLGRADHELYERKAERHRLTNLPLSRRSERARPGRQAV